MQNVPEIFDYESSPIEDLEIPYDLDPSYSRELIPPAFVREETGVDTDNDQHDISLKWKEFVETVAASANQSLVSLLRNSVLSQLDEKQLVIGYQNLKVFSEDKRRVVQRYAKDFFNPKLDVVFKETATGVDKSLKEQQDLENKRCLEERIRIAKNDKKVLLIKQLFPDCKIIDISPSEE